MGRALNPRCEFFGVDLKQLGMRSALIGWLLIDWMYLAQRFKLTQTVEPALAFVVLCHTVYILFSVRNEVRNEIVNAKVTVKLKITWDSDRLANMVCANSESFMFLLRRQSVIHCCIYSRRNNHITSLLVSVMYTQSLDHKLS